MKRSQGLLYANDLRAAVWECLKDYVRDILRAVSKNF